METLGIAPLWRTLSPRLTDSANLVTFATSEREPERQQLQETSTSSLLGAVRVTREMGFSIDTSVDGGSKQRDIKWADVCFPPKEES
jgi:hypothetical protein